MLYSFHKHGLIWIIFCKQHQNTSKKIMCLFNIAYPFTITYFKFGRSVWFGLSLCQYT